MFWRGNLYFCHNCLLNHGTLNFGLRVNFLLESGCKTINSILVQPKDAPFLLVVKRLHHFRLHFLWFKGSIFLIIRGSFPD